VNGNWGGPGRLGGLSPANGAGGGSTVAGGFGGGGDGGGGGGGGYSGGGGGGVGGGSFLSSVFTDLFALVSEKPGNGSISINMISPTAAVPEPST
jgi:hypothetical protein